MTDYKGYDIDRLSESINNKADRDLSNVVGCDVVVEYKTPTSNDLSWYRLYQSGWIEQGGRYPDNGTGSTERITVTFPKEFADTNYYITVQHWATVSDSYNNSGTVFEITPTSFVSHTYDNDKNTSMTWYACGMAKVS